MDEIFCPDSSPTSPLNPLRVDNQQPYENMVDNEFNTNSQQKTVDLLAASQELSSRTSPSMSSDADQRDLSKQFYGIVKKKDQSLMNVLPGAEENLIPEAMPLIRKISLLNSREPDIYQRLKRGITNKYFENQKEPVCHHDEVIENWKCGKCKSSIPKFNLIFDDQEGRVKTFTRIVYENSFLQDFKESFKA
jgi:hypothetical protein